MLISAVSVLVVVAQSSSEVPEGLMNNPVYSDQAAAAVCHKNYSYRHILMLAPT